MEILRSHKSSLADQEGFKKQLSDVTKKTVENTISIHNVQSDFSNDVMTLTAKINKAEQQRIDDEIFISGFSSKPDADFAVNELCKLFNFPISSISKKYSYEFLNRSKNIKEGHVVIKFNSKTDQINFNKIKLQHGPVFVDQLMVNTPNNPTRQSLKISNRHTPSNRSIIASLRISKKKEKLPRMEFVTGIVFMK